LYNYCNSYVFMNENIELAARQDDVLYGSETEEKSSLEALDKLVILRVIGFISLPSREMQAGEIRNDDMFYLFETEEKRVWEE